jgi:hypothetical protein
MEATAIGTKTWLSDRGMTPVRIGNAGGRGSAAK